MRSTESILKDAVRALGLHYVGQRGIPGSKVVVVGEAPGKDENRIRLPFVGPSGKELGRMFKDAGWKGEYHEIEFGNQVFCPHDVWFTNVFKVQPPENKLARLEEYGIPTELFVQSFLEEIRSFKPSIIIATGNTSLGTLCPETRGKDTTARIGTYRGSLLRSKLLDWNHYVIPCYHPAFILREWKERPLGVFCLERAREEYAYLEHTGTLQPLLQRKFILQPSFDTLYEWLSSCIFPYPRRVSIDLELLCGWPAVCGIARSPTEAISFSLWDYLDDQLVKIWRLLNEIVKRCRQIGQNYIGFDCTWLEWLGLEPNLSLVTDTMVLHHVLWLELPHKLQFIGMQYTREPYWKDEGRKWRPKDGIKTLMHYNALDAACTFESCEVMERELEARCG